MTAAQIKELDALFQKQVLEDWEHISILSGEKAEVVHHFIGRRKKATRWYKPNGIPLTDAEHKQLEYNDRKQLEGEIIKRLGTIWHERLLKQSNRTAKYLDHQKVKDHLQKNTKNYIDNWYV